MRAIVFDRHGDPEVLHLVERPVPEPGPGEVRVRVVVSGVNPTDWKERRGRGSSAAPLAAPKVPNQDGAGVVDALGPGVDGFAVGDPVWVWDAAWRRLDGTAQEFVVLPARQVVRLPGDGLFDLGASLGIPALTAHRALTVGPELPDVLAPGALDGRAVLVAGGAGAVGHAAIQLARWAGASVVVATVSSDGKGELARRAGAHVVVDYRADDAAARIRAVAPDGVDVIVEVDPVRNVELDAAVAAERASIASYTGPGALAARFDGTGVVAEAILTYTVPAAEKDASVRAVAAAVADGALPVGEEHGLPLLRFPLERTADAHRAVEEGAVGKVLVDVTAP